MVDKEIIKIKTCELYDLFSVKCVDILLAHKLLSAVYNVIWYSHLVHTARTPEATSLARWSLEDARDRLGRVLRKTNFCDLDKNLVKYIANNFEFDEYGE